MDTEGEGAVAAVRARFWATSEFFLASANRSRELARAMNDREAIVREQIKVDVMKHARAILDESIEHVRLAREV